MLLEIDADTAEQHVAPADIGVVGEGWRVDGDQRRVVPASHQLDRQRVVAQTAAAIHPGGTGGDREDLHECTMLNAECSMLNDETVSPRVAHWALGIRPFNS